jgi:molecular chaperone GrpE
MSIAKRPSTQRPLIGRPFSARHRRASEEAGPLAALEQDTRNLMRQLAEARASDVDRQQQHQQTIRRLLLRLLDVNDAFERVFRTVQSKPDVVTPQMKIWIGNFRAVYSLLEDILSEQGLAPIESLAQGFDPHWHRAIEVVDNPDKRPGTILEELKKGYMWQNHVLRKAEVVVVRMNDGDTAPSPHAKHE